MTPAILVDEELYCFTDCYTGFQPFPFVVDKGFKTLVKTLNPCTKTLSEKLHQKYMTECVKAFTQGVLFQKIKGLWLCFRHQCCNKG